MLYTSAAGQRRVRVHNLSVPVTSLLANVFRFADMDTTITYIAKDCQWSRLHTRGMKADTLNRYVGITSTGSKPLRQVRDQLTELCVKALLAYRKHCASSTSPAQVSQLHFILQAQLIDIVLPLWLSSLYYPSHSNYSPCMLLL